MAKLSHRSLPKLTYRSLTRRLMHWAGFFGLSAVLIVTGVVMYFLSPTREVPLGVLGSFHMLAGVLLVAVSVIWVYLVVAGGGAERRELALSPAALRHARTHLTFYTLPKRPPAQFGHHNPVQILLYQLWAVVLVATALTGVALWGPGSLIGRGLGNLLGPIGLHAAHVIAAALFLAVLALHAYVAILDAVFTRNGAFSAVTFRRESAVPPPTTEESLAKQLGGQGLPGSFPRNRSR